MARHCKATAHSSCDNDRLYRHIYGYIYRHLMTAAMTTPKKPTARKAPKGRATASLSSTNPLVYMRTPATPCTKLKPLVKAPSLQICNSNTVGYYSYTATLEAPRPGADDHLRCPSRTGDELRFVGEKNYYPEFQLSK